MSAGGRSMRHIPFIFAFFGTVGMLYMLDLPPFGGIKNFEVLFGQEIPEEDIDMLYNNGEGLSFNDTSIIYMNDTEVLDEIQKEDYAFNKSTVLDYDDLLTDDYNLEDI